MSYLEFSPEEKITKIILALEKDPDSVDLKKKLYHTYVKDDCDSSIIESITKTIESYSIVNNSEELCADIFSCLVLYGASPDEYFEFGFKKLNHCGRSEFFCDRQRFKIFHSFYDFDYYEQIRNKWQQYNMLKEFFHRECILIRPDTDELSSFLNFCGRHHSFVVKPTRSFHGDGVHFFDSNIDNPRTIYERIKQNECICDEPIQQNAFFERFHKESVNTVRIVAIRKNGINTIIHPQLHIGRGSSVADNDIASIRANIDSDTGIVYTPGFDHYMNEFLFHPDSNEQIVGIRIPSWNNLINTIGIIMERIEKIGRYIGFDMALTEKGWTIVEINPFPQLYSQQLVDKKGYRKEIESICNNHNSED